VAERDGQVLGFAACDKEELAWLYVEPRANALEQFPDIGEIEALKGNEPARALYESLGFQVAEIQKGRMPGNEDFPVEVYVLRRK
jgi:ribosomal protein S18 acetylase RimI-like enzyme